MGRHDRRGVLDHEVGEKAENNMNKLITIATVDIATQTAAYKVPK